MRRPTGSDGAGDGVVGACVVGAWVTGACVVGAWVTGACVAGVSSGGSSVIGAVGADGSDCASDVVVSANVDCVSAVNELPVVVSIASELSTSIATTSEGEEPHDATTNNIERARPGAIICERRGFTRRDYAGLQLEYETNTFIDVNGISDG